MPENGKSPAGVGKVVEIRGVVLDAVFPGDLPEINHALRIKVAGEEGRPEVDLIAEVQQHLGNDRVRAQPSETFLFRGDARRRIA